MEDIKRVRLSEIAGLITKGTTPTTLGYEFQEDGVNFLKIECFDENGGFIESKVAHISEECNEKLKRSQLKAGDVLFSIAGAIGRVAIVTEEMLPANTNQALAIIRIADEQVYLPYIKLILTSPIVIEQFEKKKQGVAQLNLSLKDINEISIPLPSKEKQIELAELFDKVAGVIAKRKTEISALDDLIKARFVEMFGDPVVHLDKGETVKLDTLAEKITVGFVGEASNEYVYEGVPYLRTQNVRVNRIDLAGLIYVNENFHNKNQKSIIHPGDVVISRVGVNRGMAAMVPDTLPEANIANCLIVGQTDNINSYYLAFYMNMSFGKRPQFGASVGSAQGVVNTSILKKWEVFVPDRILQDEFYEFAKQVDKSKVAVQKSLDETQQLFDSLMQKYFG